MAKKYAKQAEKAYESIKRRLGCKQDKFEEEAHSKLIMEIMLDPNRGTVAAFCREAVISSSTFYAWCKKSPIFNECYRAGQMIAQANWEEDGHNNQNELDFNFDYWKSVGAQRFGIGRTNRVRLDVDKNSNPYEQYQQLIEQATYGDFDSAQIKQLMESINVGRAAFEAFKLQGELDEIKESFKLMEVNRNAHNTIPITSAEKANKGTISN